MSRSTFLGGGVEKWSPGLITRLLEITHRQWVYQNLIVHDLVLGTIATARKEELLWEIEQQQELGDEGLLEEDKYLAVVNLVGLETTKKEWQHYWLLAIKTLQKAKILREQQEQQQTVSRNTRGMGRYISIFGISKRSEMFLVPPTVWIIKTFLSHVAQDCHAYKNVMKGVILSYVVLLQRCLATSPWRMKTP